MLSLNLCIIGFTQTVLTQLHTVWRCPILFSMPSLRLHHEGIYRPGWGFGNRTIEYWTVGTAERAQHFMIYWHNQRHLRVLILLFQEPSCSPTHPHISTWIGYSFIFVLWINQAHIRLCDRYICADSRSNMLSFSIHIRSHFTTKLSTCGNL